MWYVSITPVQSIFWIKTLQELKLILCTYLWNTLIAFTLPAVFISSVKVWFSVISACVDFPWAELFLTKLYCKHILIAILQVKEKNKLGAVSAS